MSLVFLLAAFFSEVIGTIAGFGSSTVFLPLALLFTDFKTALVLVAMMHVLGNIARVSFFHKGLKLNFLLKFGIPSVVLTIIGAYLVAFLPQEILKGFLGVTLMLYSISSLMNHNLKLKQTPTNIALAGGLSGFLTGLVGTGGALRGAFLTAFNVHKESYIATAAVVAIVTDLTRIPVYIYQGFLDQRLLPNLYLLVIPAILGSFVGKKVVKTIPQEKFKKIVLIAILLVGINFIYTWLV